MNLTALGQVRDRRLLAHASSAIFAFSAESIFRLVRFVIVRSVCCDGTAPDPIVNRSSAELAAVSFRIPTMSLFRFGCVAAVLIVPVPIAFWIP